jgi:rare lipoprotein A
VKAPLTLFLALVCAACAPHKVKPSQPAPGTAGSADSPVAETSLPQSERYRDRKDGGPAKPAVDIAALPEPIPKVEPRSRYGNKSPYSVLGKTYTVMAKADEYVERGIASWYGNKFHGYMTSSLEPYDMYQFSAAHKSLPLPTYARVTNLENGKSVVVRVNDRGPFHENRLIDLSFAAAVRIGVWPKGTGLVEVRALSPGHGEAEPKAPAAVPDIDVQPRIFLQLGAFADRDNALRTVERFGRAGIGRASIVTTRINDREIHRVRLGPLPDIAAADALAARIERLGLGVARVAIDE